MKAIGEAVMYARFLGGLPALLRRRISLEQAEAIVRHRIARREEAFLGLLRKGVFGNPRSPYLPLLHRAGIGLPDVERMACADGLDSALHELFAAGVYVTFEEFKGRTPIVRDGREVPVHERAFDNPFLSRCYQATSSGSTGAGTRSAVDLAHLLDELPVKIVSRAANGFLMLPTAQWRAILPARAGLANCLRGAVIGNVPRKWFTPVAEGEIGLPLRHRLATRYVLAVGRLLGHPLPQPEVVPLDRPEPVLDWVLRTLSVEGKCALSASPSASARVCVGAYDRGIDLTGLVCTGGGEPPTPGKVAAVTATGARWVPNYGTTEVGNVGIACANPVDGNDLHVVRDGIALIQREREVPGWGESVRAFFVTTLLPSAPKIMLNVGLDDYGVLERRSCGCPLEALGYTEHVREIRSYSKLTGEGVTLIGTDLVAVLDEVLPERLGGSPLDYQLVEEEGSEGFTRLSLLISPRVQLRAGADPVRLILESLRERGLTSAYAAAFWRQAGSLRVVRADPVHGREGKLLPLRIDRKGGPPS